MSKRLMDIDLDKLNIRDDEGMSDEDKESLLEAQAIVMENTMKPKKAVIRILYYKDLFYRLTAMEV